MLSETIWRVEWDEGFGWPLCTHRERKVRRYTSAKAAAATVAMVLAMPSHHRLVRVLRGRWDEADEPVGYDNPEDAADAMLGPLPPVGCSACGHIPARPGPCDNNILLASGEIKTCTGRARFVAHTSRDDTDE